MQNDHELHKTAQIKIPSSFNPDQGIRDKKILVVSPDHYIYVNAALLWWVGHYLCFKYCLNVASDPRSVTWSLLNFSTAPCGKHNILSPKMSCKGSFYFLSWISNTPFLMFLDGVSYISSAVKKIGQLVCQLICTSCGVPLLVVYVLLCFQGVDVFEYSLSVHNCICDACVADVFMQSKTLTSPFPWNAK